MLSGVEWVVTTLRNVTRDHGNIQLISLYLPDVPYSTVISRTDPSDGMAMVGEAMYSLWSELDRLLVQLWESHSIRPEVTCDAPPEGAWSWVDCLLPELMKRGAISLVE